MSLPAALPAAFRCFCLVLLLAGWGGGCMTSPERTLFDTSGPGWTVRQGQVIWRPDRKRPELAGEIVLAENSDGRRSLQFTKTLLPVTLAQTTPTHWLIQFPPQRLGFSGRGQPPTRFTWLYLPAALAGEPLPDSFAFTRQSPGGWRLENRRTGEFMEGFLAP